MSGRCSRPSRADRALTKSWQSLWKRQSLAHRAYDVSKGGAKAHEQVEDDETVESQVKGMAEDIVKRDAARRKEELVSTTLPVDLLLLLRCAYHVWYYAGLIQHTVSDIHGQSASFAVDTD